MIVVLLGASGSGKSTIENELATHHGYKKVISYTTRQPRHGEVNGKDYYFISNEEFNEMKNLGLFAEWDEYSQGRCYGTLKADYADDDKVVVLTPNGLRQLLKTTDKSAVLSVLVKTSLGTRIKRYIDRIGVDNFTYDDKNEIASRVERDYSMFLGMEREVDKVIWNDGDVDIKDLVSDILND